MKVSIVIPVYNERKTIREIFNRVKDVKFEKEIIIVDDGSTDGTTEVLKEIAKEGARIFYHDKNKGKGAALRTGFSDVKGDIIIIQDADLEYDPSQYQKLVQPILEGRADVVYGSRFMNATQSVSFLQSVGNRLLSSISNLFTGLSLTDMETGYKIFTRKVLNHIDIEEDGFGVEPEITAKIARTKARIVEVGISYYVRSRREGKKITWIDGIHALWCIIKYNLIR